MKKMLILLTMATILSVFSVNVNAQLGFAVAKDENGSSIRWKIAFVQGNIFERGRTAVRRLESEGYKKVYNQTGSDKYGHDVATGYWVVVVAEHKIYDGSYKRSYGMGASSNSYSEAEKRATVNLSTYDWSWNRSNGYKVDRRGTY